MNELSDSDKSQRNTDQIAWSMISSLFSSPTALAASYLAHIAGIVLCWVLTRDTAMLALAGTLALVTVARILMLMAFNRYAKSNPQFANHRRWEIAFIAGSCAAAGVLGLPALIATVRYQNSAAMAISLTLVCANLIGVVGRSFGSRANIDLTVFFALAPTCAGLVYAGAAQGETMFLVLGLMLIPLGTMTRHLARFVHFLLRKSLVEHSRLVEVSRSFRVAVSKMPNGLVVMEADGTVLLANDMAGDLLGGSGNLLGRNLFDIVKISESRHDELDRLASFLRGENDRIEYQTKDGRWLECRSGVVPVAEDGDAPSFDNKSVILLEDVTEKVTHRSQIEHVARHDPLTDLPNRHYMGELVAAKLKRLPAGALVAVCVFDVDKFKVINDTLGHHVGDMVIKGVADKLKAMDRRKAYVSRWGGDEFVVFLSDVSSEEDARQVFDALFGQLCSTFLIQNENVEVRCSGGVAIRRAEEFDLQQDIAKADMALYKVKRDPNKAWSMFTADMESEYDRVLRIKQDLKDAISSGALEVVYQPIVSVKDWRINCCEALCRWRHEEAGFISPMEFIPLAEEIGFIGKLSEYVLRTAVNDAAKWAGNVMVSVNLSALDLWRDDIVDVIRSALEESGLPARRLCIELTETVFIKDHKRTARVLQEIRDLGVVTAIDDFGTVYSSLAYLHTLPMDKVKIDRAFLEGVTRDPATQRLFKGIVSLANELGYEVIVEGVEDMAQMYVIRDSIPGITAIQGYAFSPPLENGAVSNKVHYNFGQRRDPTNPWFTGQMPAFATMDNMPPVKGRLQG